MIWSISWRNVWRNKLRSLIIIIAVTVGLFGGIISAAFMIGWLEQRTDAAIEYEISNIQLHNPKFLLNEEINFTINNPDKIINEIKTVEGVKAVCKRTKSTAMASTATTGTGIIINGINPAQEKQVTKLYEKLLQGHYFEKDDKIPAVIGQKLASKLNTSVGSKIVITIANVEGIITYGAFRVIGIYKTSNDMFDEVNVFVRNDELINLISFDKNKTSEIAVALDENKETNKIAEILRKKFNKEITEDKFVIQTWIEIQPTLNAMNEMMNYFSFIFQIVILIALAFGIVNTMLMVVMERTHEIGMLMAIGMNKNRIFFMIMLETIFLSIIGGIGGIIISYFVVGYFSIHGINLSIVSEGLNSIGFSSIVYLNIDSQFYIFTALLVVITAIISSIYPARKALKLNPADAVRENV
ncbi:MAG: ABC transporter permease [Bacteroidales bacterium]|nr:ABC transporter permease [Bacteroidales bacterium]